MAWSLVGSTSGLVAATTSTVALPGTPAADDWVIICQSRRSAGATANTAPTGYSTKDLNGAGLTNLFADSTDDTNASIFFKKMGATPDTSVILNGPGATQVSSYTIHVIRGLNTSSPFDPATPVTVTKIGLGAPDPGSITPAGSSVPVMVFAAAGGPNTAGEMLAFTAPANIDTTAGYFVSAVGTRTATAGGIQSGVTGAFDPSTFGGGHTSATTATSAAITIALAPASTGGSTPITGTSATTLGTFTTAAVAKVKVKALSSTSLDAFTVASVAKVKVKASLNQSLNTFTTTAVAKAKIKATLNQSLSPFTTAATTKVKVKANVSSTLGTFISVAAAKTLIHGLGSGILNPFTTSVTARVKIRGSVNSELNAFTLSSTAKVRITVSVHSELDAFTTSGTITVPAQPLQADVSSALGEFTTSGEIKVIVTASVAAELGSFTTNGLIMLGALLPPPLKSGPRWKYQPWDRSRFADGWYSEDYSY